MPLPPRAAPPPREGVVFCSYVSYLRPAQRAGARDAGVGAVPGHQKWNLAGLLIDGPVRQVFRDAFKERAHRLGYSAAHHHDVRLEKVHNVAKPHGQHVSGPGENLGGHGIALAKSLAYVFGANLLQAAGQLHNSRRAGAAQPGLRPPGDVWARGQRLDATALPASAAVSVEVDGHVAALGRATGAPVVDLPVEDDPRADTGAERSVKD